MSKQRDAIFAADDGAAPPLSQRGPALPWGHLGGSEALMPPGLRQVRFPARNTWMTARAAPLCCLFTQGESAESAFACGMKDLVTVS